MKPSLDRALRIVWLVIGVLLLGTLVVSLAFFAAGFLRTRGAAADADRAVAEAVPAEADGAGVRLTLPQRVRGTDTRIAFVVRPGAPAPRAPEPGRVQGVVNVVFLDPDGAPRLLLDRPAEVREVRFPAEGEEGEEPQRWITYEIAHGGEVALFLSALDGRSLRHVVAPPLRYLAHRPFGPGRVLVYAMAGAPPRQRAFLYDVDAAALTPFAALDSVAAEAARIAAP